MQRLLILALLFTAGCSKQSPQGSPENSATSAVSAVAPSATASAAAAPLQSWYVGSWKGDFAVSRRPSTTTTKQGGPSAWEKDNGQKLSGGANSEISVDPEGQVTGSLKGALGDLELRGKVEGEQLRASLVAKTDDPTAIHNGNLVLTHEADTLKGRLMAATGDALILRQAEVVLKKVAP